MSKPRVAILGLGIMGSGMAARVLQDGFPLTVYNRTAARAEPLVIRGARLATSPREAAAGADVVLAMVADDVASRAMWLGESGALAGARAGAVLIDSSTLSVGWIDELHELARRAGCDFLDAPVTGTKPHAAAGELSFLVGGEAAVLDRVRPVLQTMGKSVLHLGGPGSGARMKLINNFVCGTQLVALAEAIALIERTDLNRDQALSVLTGGAPGSPLVKTLAARMTAGDFTPNFLLRLLVKDLTYAIEEADRHSIQLTTAKTAAAQLQRAVDSGLGEKDMSSLVELLRQ